jgi:hypothetical protein
MRGMRLILRAFRHALAILIAGAIAHAALIGLALAAGLGGQFSAFAASAIQFGATVALTLGVAPDGMTQVAGLVFGAWWAPLGIAIAGIALFAIVIRSNAFLGIVGLTVVLGTLPIGLRALREPPGAPPAGIADMALVAGCAALGGAIYWVLAGRVIGKSRQRRKA